MKNKVAINGMEEDKEMDAYSKPCLLRISMGPRDPNSVPYTFKANALLVG